MANSLAPTYDLWKRMAYLGEQERHDGQVGTVMAEFCLQCIPGEAWAQVELPRLPRCRQSLVLGGNGFRQMQGKQVQVRCVGASSSDICSGQCLPEQSKAGRRVQRQKNQQESW